MVRRAMVLGLLLALGAAYVAFASKSEPVLTRRPLSELPTYIGNWDEVGATDLDPRILAVVGADDYTNRVYGRVDGSSLGLYIGYYKSQRQGDTIHSPLNCLPGSGWNPVRRGRVSIPVDGDSAIEINRIIILKGMDRRVVLYWYQSHGRVIASEYWGKIYTVLDALRTNKTDAALVRVICPVQDPDTKGELAAEQRAVDFVKALFPLLGRFLPA